MAERKVLNKYFPPDFDPAKIPRRKMAKDKQQTVRLMAPYSMRCATCGEYIYKGKKFNARKETVEGEEYYGIKLFRFYIKCTQCSAEITFKTDPKNADYTAEHGAIRNFEPWRESADELAEDKLTRMEEEENNPMAALENKSVDSKREMDILDALQELKTRNARIERAGKGTERVLDGVSSRMELGDVQIMKKIGAFEDKRRREEEEDEEEVSRVFGRTYVAGVPDIELDDGASTAPSESDGGTDDGSEASGTGSTSSSSLPVASSIKRKLDTVEPTPAELLSAASRSIVTKAFGAGLLVSSSSSGSAVAAAGASPSMGPPKKKKGKSDLANKLGIKLKK